MCLERGSHSRGSVPAPWDPQISEASVRELGSQRAGLVLASTPDAFAKDVPSPTETGANRLPRVIRHAGIRFAIKSTSYSHVPKGASFPLRWEDGKPPELSACGRILPAPGPQTRGSAPAHGRQSPSAVLPSMGSVSAVHRGLKILNGKLQN